MPIRLPGHDPQAHSDLSGFVSEQARRCRPANHPLGDSMCVPSPRSVTFCAGKHSAAANTRPQDSRGVNSLIRSTGVSELKLRRQDQSNIFHISTGQG